MVRELISIVAAQDKDVADAISKELGRQRTTLSSLLL
jgi:hypothetical protein